MCVQTQNKVASEANELILNKRSHHQPATANVFPKNSEGEQRRPEIRLWSQATSSSALEPLNGLRELLVPLSILLTAIPEHNKEVKP